MEGHGGVFVVTEGNELRRLKETDFVSEDDFQSLLEQYPDLLPGDQIAPDKPRRWLLIAREAAIQDRENGAGRWALDHLFVDQDGIPTFVEVKRRGDSRIRREVVGQLLDYAANAVAYWPQDELLRLFEETVTSAERDPDAVLVDFLDASDEADAFWDRLTTNLRAGKLRLLIVADHVPAELQRVIEFLNAQMGTTEILGVELRHYAGEGVRTLVPRVVGKTTQAEGAKRSAGLGRGRPWDRESILQHLRDGGFPQMEALADELMTWAADQDGFYVRFGAGRLYPSFSLAIGVGNSFSSPVHFSYNQDIGLFGYLQYGHLKPFAAFESVDAREQVLRSFQGIAPDIRADNIERYPTFRVATLLEPRAKERFKDFLLWIAQCLWDERQPPT